MTAKHIIDAIDPRAFCDRWEELEHFHGEQASLAITCEEFGISYEDAEWVRVVEKVKDKVRPAAEAIEVLERVGYKVIWFGKYGNRVLRVYTSGRHVVSIPVRAGCVNRAKVARLVQNSEKN